MLKSPNLEDFEIGLNLAYKEFSKEEFEDTMKSLLEIARIPDMREAIFVAYGKTYKRYGSSVWKTGQSIEEAVLVGYKEIKLE